MILFQSILRCIFGAFLSAIEKGLPVTMSTESKMESSPEAAERGTKEAKVKLNPKGSLFG